MYKGTLHKRGNGTICPCGLFSSGFPYSADTYYLINHFWGVSGQASLNYLPSIISGRLDSGSWKRGAGFKGGSRHD